MPVHDIGLPIRVLTNALDEDWLVAEDEEVLEDGFSSDTNRTYDYPETPASLTEDDGFYSENWYDIDEDSDEFDDEEGKVPALWRTEELLRKLQRTTIYESSSSSYNSERSSSDLNF
ncbi:hypothetical protein Gasu2_45370 [Galdieria sulphuraria]|nr:hypothetical protein Gasu2_45370 [Galdieria sulphuraria]